jgi:acyl-[acyl-carrier-protein]-phospholipid O-acyltransferase / long-chain-fatty-acid--[acyl-carrier-protein] ligase
LLRIEETAWQNCQPVQGHDMADNVAASLYQAPVENESLPGALLAARARFGGAKEIVEDQDRTALSYDRLILGAMVLGRKLTSGMAERENVGVLLPNVNGCAVTIFGLLFRNRVPVMLNFTAGLRNLQSACDTAKIRTIITARKFIENAKLDDLVAALGQGRRIVWLEDVRAGLTVIDKVLGALDARLRAGSLAARIKASDPAFILFTSGSEGKPKGVVLTHGNIIANVRQIAAAGHDILRPEDIMFNPLPVFHSYGLTAGLMTGVLSGMKVVLYPSPLHYREVPRLIGKTKATILFGTDTFLVGYARAADKDDLTSVRYVITGAERVKDDTRRLWDPFGTTILEGYGCTECSPVLACNVPSIMKDGTVGPLLPGINWRLDPVEGISEGGKLVVKGANVMAGYMLADRPGEIVPPVDGWHDTGDIVTVDDEGCITIKGRAKRFAKIGGEMVSLAAIETMAADLWPGVNHVAVSLPDPRKGEQIILVTEQGNADRAALMAHARAQGFPELWVPRAILVLEQIPVLGSGKIDYAGTADEASSKRALM